MKIRFTLLCVMLTIGLNACKKDEMSDDLTPNFSASTQQVLAGESVVFTDMSEGQASSWSWEFEGGTPAKSDLSGPTVTYNQPGTYAVTLEIKNSRTSAVEKRVGYITVNYKDVAAAFTASASTIKQDESVTFTDNSAGMPNQWAWEFKSGTTVLTSAVQNPVVKFTVPGIYTVTLVATNPKGSNTVVKQNAITVIDITSVEANFESSQTATYTGGNIAFTDKSIGTATSWSWTFEGPSTILTSNDQNPTVTFAAAGRYKVKLVAANTVKSSTVEKEGYVLVVPGASLTAFYPLDGSINDFGPSKLVSTIAPGATVGFLSADRKAIIGRTGVFDGSGGFVVPDNDAMNFGTGDYSVSCWVKTSTQTSAMVWQESGGKGAGDNQTWLRLRGSAVNLTSFSTEEPAPGGGTTINLTAAISPAAATNDNVWHHIVCTRSGTLTTIYIDGVNIRTATASAVKTVSNAGIFKVGMQENAAGYLNKFNGLIDDLIIYKKALNQAEVAALFNL